MPTATLGAAPQARMHRAPQAASPKRSPIRPRRPGMVAVAVLLIAAGALGGLQLFTAADTRVAVLVLAKQVPAGHRIEPSDLRTAELAGKVAYTRASAESSVVGKVAARDLFAGQLLTASMLSTTSVPDADHALVGLELKPGQAPAAGVSDGDHVELVQVPSGSATEPSASLLATGTVFATSSDTNSASELVTVLVPRTQAAALAAAASAGQVSLIRVGG